MTRMRCRWTLITTAAALAPRWQPRSLGQTDLKTQVPLGVGTWQAGNRLLYDYSPARDAALLEAWSSAAAAGVSYFDSGDSYGTGELEGNAETLLGRFSETTANVCVHTKLATYPWRLRAEDFVAACEESGRRTGGVALVGQHWSAESYGLGFLQDPAVYRGLAACVTRGLARGVGLSNLGPRGLRRGVDAVNAAGAPVATHQTQFSLLCRAPLEDGSFDASLDEEKASDEAAAEFYGDAAVAVDASTDVIASETAGAGVSVLTAAPTASRPIGRAARPRMCSMSPRTGGSPMPVTLSRPPMTQPRISGLRANSRRVPRSVGCAALP